MAALAAKAHGGPRILCVRETECEWEAVMADAVFSELVASGRVTQRPLFEYKQERTHLWRRSVQLEGSGPTTLDNAWRQVDITALSREDEVGLGDEDADAWLRAALQAET
jgi:hypothetical protein